MRLLFILLLVLLPLMALSFRLSRVSSTNHRIKSRFSNSLQSSSLQAIVTSSSPTSTSTMQASYDTQYIDGNKLKWSPTGYKSWTWRDQKINYVDVGGDKSKPPLLLIHGFGASAYHWRYNIPALAEKYHVYALDLLGFGLSDKPLIEYQAEVWRDQILAFIEEIVFQSSYRSTPIPCTVVGNSLGGFAALHATSADEKNLISGCVLVNAAGRFKKFSYPKKEENSNGIIQAIGAAFQRFVINLSFMYTKQPQRIEQVLRQVYPVIPDQVDSELVDSIQLPAQHPNAAEVFYRIISRNGNGPPIFIDDLLERVKVPLLLLWGDKDPWIRPTSADAIQEIFPSAQRVNLDAGHCAHDEVPEDFNRELLKFMENLHVAKEVAIRAA